MLDLTLIDDGDGLEAAMRMHADTARLLCRGEVGRPGIVEQQERADMVAVAGVREQRADRKAVAHPMLPGAAEDTENLSHDEPP